MLQHAAPEKLVTATDKKKKKTRVICLCGKNSEHATRTDCLIARPGTPWYNAFRDAEPGEDVIVRLPREEIHLTVKRVIPLKAANKA